MRDIGFFPEFHEKLKAFFGEGNVIADVETTSDTDWRSARLSSSDDNCSRFDY